MTVSLPYERGRLAFKAVAGVAPGSCSRAGRGELELAPLDDHYAAESRAALHHLERSLFEDEPAAGRGAAAAPSRFHSAGGERAEVELAGRARARPAARRRRAGRRRGGVPRSRRATRRWSSRSSAPTASRTRSTARVPSRPHRPRPRPARADPRCARDRARARGPARLPAHAGPADACRAWPTASRPRCARTARTTRRDARARWERRPLAARRARPPRAGARDGRPSSASSRAELARLFAAPYERRATVLSGPQLDEARASSTPQRARSPSCAAVLGGEARATRSQRAARAGSSSRCAWARRRSPTACRWRPRRRSGRAASRPCSPAGFRRASSRRGASPEPFLSDEDRRAIATRERPACCRCARTGSTASATCSTSARRAPSGCSCCARGPATRRATRRRESFFVDDVRELLEDGAELRKRSLSEVTWRPEDAPTAAEWERALAAAARARPVPQPPAAQRRAAARRSSSARDAVAARALENFADCPVKWLVEDRPASPRSSCRTPRRWCAAATRTRCSATPIERVREETGARRVTHGNLADAERILLEELRDRSAKFQLSPKQTRVRAAARRLEFDLLRFLRRRPSRDAASSRSSSSCRSATDADAIRWSSRAACRCADVSTAWTEHDGMALVIDYKTGKSVDSLQGRRAGSRRTASRPRSTCWSSRSCSDCARPVASTWRSGATIRARAGWSPRKSTSSGALGPTGDRLERRGVPGRSSTGRSGGSARRTR